MSDIPPPSTSLTTLLPFLFAPIPTPLPVHLLSPTTHLSHTFLSTSPSSPSYLQLVPSGTLSALHARLVERGIADLVLGPSLYTIEEGGIRGRVEVSLQDEEIDPRETDALAIDLVWEQGGREGDDDDAGPRWLFVTLSLVTRGKHPKGWHKTLEFARVSATSPRARQAQTPDDFLPPSSIPIAPRVPGKSVEDMASGEGTTPGAYGAAEDFWSGWSYDGEDDEESGERAEFVREAEQERKLQDAQEGCQFYLLNFRKRDYTDPPALQTGTATAKSRAASARLTSTKSSGRTRLARTGDRRASPAAAAAQRSVARHSSRRRPP